MQFSRINNIVIRGVIVGLMFAALSFRTSAATIPSTGSGEAVAELDEVMIRFVKKIDCTAGALTIQKDGVVLYERAYGWLDQAKEKPAPVNVCMGIASCEKPITASAVRKLAADGKLSLEEPLLKTLGITLEGKVRDQRVNAITVSHVLDHKAGWAGDIRQELMKLATKAGKYEPTEADLLSYLGSVRLESAPGSKGKYSNFGFDVLRYLVSAKSGMTEGEYYRQGLLPAGSSQDVGRGDEINEGGIENRAVWNMREGGPIYASTGYMAAFMRNYWLTGFPRDKGQPFWVMFGSLPGSTSLMIWRMDGFDIAANFNGRNDTGHGTIGKALEKALNEVKDRLTGRKPEPGEWRFKKRL